MSIVGDRSIGSPSDHIRRSSFRRAACRLLDQPFALGHLGRLRGQNVGRRAPGRAPCSEPCGRRPTGRGISISGPFRDPSAEKSDRQPLTDLQVNQAAVDEQFGAGGVGGIGGEVEGCGGDFGGGAGAAERNAGLGPLDEVILLSRCEAPFVEDWCDDRTGADAVDPDAARRQLLGDGAAERTQRRLGRIVLPPRPPFAPATEAVRMIAPPSGMTGMACLIRKYAPLTLMLKWLS